jgi:hypothetical protein
MATTFTRSITRNIGTSLTTVYTGIASTQSIIISLTVANTTGSQVLADVVVTNTSTDYYIVKSAPVPSGSSLVAVGTDSRLVVVSGDTVRVKSDTATSIDVVVSVLEVS